MNAILIVAAFLLCPSPGKSLATLEEEFSAQNYLARVKWLAAEELEGRGTGSVGQKAAAGYISNQFRKFGLQPLGDEGEGYFQRFPVTIRRPPRIGRQTKLSWKRGSGELQTLESRAVMPFAFSAKGEAKGPAVFVGYSITSSELAYDDFSGIDVKGKIALCLRHSPGEANPESRFGAAQMKVGTFVNKAKAAAAAGAVALVLANDSNHKEDEMMALGAAGEPSTIPVIQIRRDEMAKLLQLAGKELAAVQKAIDASLKPNSFFIPELELDLFADIEAGTIETVSTENVLAMLPGSDPELSKEAVVIGAHYDHVGFGDYGAQPKNRGKIHYGADDNASGTAAVLELAKAFAQLEPRPKRSILFMAFSGEELDLLGSKHYIEHPRFPLQDTVLMLNLDMVGRAKEGNVEVGGLSTAPALEKLVNAHNAELGLKLKMTAEVLPDSDHENFAQANIPILFFFTGYHEDYHQPGDTWEKINAADALRVTRLAMRIAHEAANAPQRLPFAGVLRKE